MTFSRSVLVRVALLVACLASVQASASVVIATTRVIFTAGAPEVTVRVSNEGRQPSLVQAWVDEGGSEDAQGELQGPFSLAPALFRLDPAKQQSLRIFHDGREMPHDRESLYWLNVLDVPPKGGGTNSLQISLRSRIKLFYRPQGLSGKPAEAHEQVTWNLVRSTEGWALQANNPTPYHVNLGKLEAADANAVQAALAGHVPPYGKARFVLSQQPQRPASITEVRYEYLDDFGAARPASAALQRGHEG
ncbi:molecular chaperone [Pseudomonas parafulva]|uniref:Molecular chaperone n=1 Tax=Pseudomonas parafulva TaxID=157782 RepID=A0AAI8KC00_9PSED|nr:molecular chaperone [Pseudomonas parafulva]AIZ33223.1 hypothetical protein NJ69_09620 [Pseudomonas parafulva]AXO88838.1 molecular chaperone [Pseudomonas parafulva]